MTRRRRSRGLVIFITVIFALLLVEGVLVAFVFVSPSAKKDLGGVGETIQRVWSGTDDSPGLKTRSARAARDLYDDWVVPLWSDPKTPPLDPEFTACVECHEDYATQRKFSVYMDHPVHAELGVACETCHPQNPHPSPPHPQEAVCADCHDQVNNKDECGYCHPPASLPHFYALGAPRDSVVDCTVCHPKNTFGGATPTPKVSATDLTGGDRQTCLSCHQDTSCQRCHAQPHPITWINDHGPTVIATSSTSCYACHAGYWCSDRCHAAVPPKPLPSVGVRP